MRISTRQMGGAVDRGSRVKILAAALAAAAVGMLALAGSASAKQISPYQYEKSFNGTGSTVGAMTTKVTGIAIDQSNGNLYVLDQHGSEASVTKFNAAGEAQVFSGLGGLSSISIAQELGFENGDIVFDNSGHGGGFYVLTGGFGGPPGGRGPIPRSASTATSGSTASAAAAAAVASGSARAATCSTDRVSGRTNSTRTRATKSAKRSSSNSSPAT